MAPRLTTYLVKRIEMAENEEVKVKIQMIPSHHVRHRRSKMPAKVLQAILVMNLGGWQVIP